MPVTVKFDPSSQTPQAQFIADATEQQAGVMSAADKLALDTLVAGSVASVTGTAPIQSTGGFNPDISITPATPLAAGSLSAADKTKLDSLQPNGGLPVYSDNGVGAPVRPAANAVGAVPGFLTIVIWNFSDNQPNYSNGTDWYDAAGNLT